MKAALVFDPRWPFHACMFALAFLFALASGIGMVLTRTSLEAGAALPLVGLWFCLVAGALFYRWRKVQRAYDLVAMASWAVLFGYLHVVPMFLAARCSAPLQDAALARIDAALGLEVPAVVRFIQGHPRAGRFLAVCYDTLLPMVTLAIMVPPLCGRMKAAKEYALGNVLAAALCLPLFAVFQAEGPWAYYEFEANPTQDNYLKVFALVRTEPTYVVDLRYRDGLITFPSFHTALAVLAACALWPIPYLRWPAAALAVLITVSTVTTGWHYLADVLAGLLVAALANMMARGCTRLESRWWPCAS